jgi:hypothetical protein
LSLPCGFSTGGLPIGLTIAGPRFSEGKILALAAAYQKITDWHLRCPPLPLLHTSADVLRRQQSNGDAKAVMAG